MLRYDHAPGRQGDAIAQRQAMLDVIADYRFFAPHKIAADERRQREMSRMARTSDIAGPVAVSRRAVGALRHRLGTGLIAAGVWLRRDAAVTLDPAPGP